MHISRIQDLDYLSEPVRPKLSEDGKILTAQNDTIFFQIVFDDFDSTKHEIVRSEHGYIRTIDGKFPQGTDGYMPREGIKSVTFQMNGKTILFPKEAYFDLFNFRRNTFLFLHNRPTGTIMIRSYNSDGAGHYMLVWKFKNYEYIGRFLGSI